MMSFLMVIVGLVVGAYFGGDPFSGMFIFLFIALAINIFSYFYSDTLVLKAYGARIIERQDSPRLYGMVKNIANINELPMPRIAIVESSTPNAFATGRYPKNAVVAATTGLMSILDDYDNRDQELDWDTNFFLSNKNKITKVNASLTYIISDLLDVRSTFSVTQNVSPFEQKYTDDKYTVGLNFYW